MSFELECSGLGSWNVSSVMAMKAELCSLCSVFLGFGVTVELGSQRCGKEKGEGGFTSSGGAISSGRDMVGVQFTSFSGVDLKA